MKVWTILLTVLFFYGCGGGSSSQARDEKENNDKTDVEPPKQPPRSVKEATEYPLARLIYYLYMPENAAASYRDATGQMSNLLINCGIPPFTRTKNDQEIDGKIERTTVTAASCRGNGTITHTIVNKDVGSVDGEGDKTSIELEACDVGAAESQIVSGAKSVEITKGTLNDASIELSFQFESFPGITRFEPESGIAVSGVLNYAETKNGTESIHAISANNFSVQLDENFKLGAKGPLITTTRDQGTNSYDAASGKSELEFELGNTPGKLIGLTIDPVFTGSITSSQSLTVPNSGVLTSQLAYDANGQMVEVKINAETGNDEKVFVQIDGVNETLDWKDFLLFSPDPESEQGRCRQI